MKRLAFLTAILLAFVVPAAAIGATVLTPAPDAQPRILLRGGVIRLGRSVYLHDNSAHAAVGITRVELINRCDLRVSFDWRTGEEIVAAMADEDESMARLDVHAGISGGGAYANVYLYRRGAKICANDPIFGTNSNVWLSMLYLTPPLQ